MTKASWVHDPGHGATLEQNWLFALRRERYRSRISGKAHDYYVIDLPDVVNVIALTPRRELILVRQFRAASGHDSLETPGGLIAEGEDPGLAGARELREETGFEGDPPRVLGTVWTNASLLTSRSTTIVIDNAVRAVEPELDHCEELVVELVPAARIPEYLRTGRIDHALAVCSLLWWLADTPGGHLDSGTSR